MGAPATAGPETKTGTSTDVFYAVNKAQRFEFPHTNCDEYTTGDLAHLYFKQSGFGSYCRRTVAALTGRVCDLDALEHNPQFVNYVVAWMRLKFVSELVDPVRYARYFTLRPRVSSKPPRLPADLAGLYDADTSPVFTHVEALVNKVQYRWIEMLMGWDGTGRSTGLDDECARLNAAIPTVRGRVAGQYTLVGVDPYDLALVPFLLFQRELHGVILGGPESPTWRAPTPLCA